MARRKKTPETSRITRGSTVAYARKQKPSGAGDGGEVGPEVEPGGEPDAAAAAGDAASGAVGLDGRFDVTDRSQPMTKIDLEGEEPAQPAAAKPEAASPEATQPEAASPEAARPEAAGEPPPPPAKAKATKAAAAGEAPRRRESAPRAPADTATVGMPALSMVGEPPEMPAEPAPSGVSPRADAVESPAHMPGPNGIPAGSPADPAAAPGLVPPGDSRSLRRRDATTYEFALIYRQGTFVITRFGVVGTRGQWRVVEYPTSTSASHSYAKECSRFVSEGFSDYRE